MTAIEPIAIARLSHSMERHGYAPAEAFARAGSLLAAHAQEQTKGQPERYSMSYAPPKERQQAQEQPGTATLEPDGTDKAVFLHHLRQRGLGHLAVMPPGQALPELPSDYAATPQDDEIFNKLMKHFSIRPGQPARASATPAQPAPPAPGTLPGAPATEPETFGREDMDRALQHQQANPGSTFQQSAAAVRNGAGEPRYSADDFRAQRLRNHRLTEQEMHAAHKYQFEHPGTPFDRACIAVLDSPERYALERSGSHVIDPGDSYTGTAAGAQEWMTRRTDEHRAHLSAAKAERRRMAELAQSRGVPLHVAGQALEMAENGEASSADVAIDKLIDRERNRNLFGAESGGLPFSITSMK